MAPEKVITEEDTLLFEGPWCRFARPARTLLGETHGQLHLLALQSASEGFKMEDGRGISQLKRPEDTRLQLINSETSENQ